MKSKSTRELVVRLNEIMKERDRLDIEHDQIIKELWERIPSLKDNVDMQPKRKVKGGN